uniref:TGF beta receptor associated protein-like protein, related n=1 Tax=Neospora caninum (strain Liverpool) TaxID=572307 RepID=A0A0F7UNS1_NEOCL|nr:TPA: TGF beta receptor associated protein-like protein, related [Neospora caninum Liverpool]
MMKVFHCVPVADIVSETISCVASSAETFLVGTETGTILKFSLADTDDPGELADGAKLTGKLRVNSGKKIGKVAVLESLQVAICIEDGNVHLLSLGLNSPGYILCKNASTFCLHEEGAATAGAEGGAGEKHRERAVRFHPELCVALKRKIVLYSKPGTDFQPYKEIALVETPLSLCWRDRWICIGTKKEFLSLHDDQEQATEILALDGQTSRGSPNLLLLPDGEVLILGLENLGIFFNLVSQTPSQRNTIKWPLDLLQVSVCLPYLVGIAASGTVDVYSIHGQSLCQKLHLPAPLTSIATNGGRLLVASGSSVNCLFPVPVEQQLHKLLLEGRTGDALDLLSANFGADDPRRAVELSAFHNLAGWVEFSHLQFPAAFRHFAYAGVDILRIISFWSADLPSWWTTPSVYLEETASRPEAARLDRALIPPVQDVSRFIRDRTAQTKAGDGGQQGEAKLQVLLELANSSMATFLSKERTSLLLGRSERVDWDALREVASAARAAGAVAHAAETKEELLALLLTLVDTLLFLLMVEGDDERWKDLLLGPQQPLTCSVDDCREFLLAIHRPDALAVMLSRFGFREEALEIWAKIVQGELRIAPKATTLSDGVQEMLALLLARDLRDAAGPEKPAKMKDKQTEESLLQRYAPLVLRADPTLARQLFFTARGSGSRYMISPSLVVRLLQEGVEDPSLSQRLQESFIEEIVMDVSGDGAEASAVCREENEGPEAESQVTAWLQEARELQTQLAKTYIDRLLAAGPSAGEATADQETQEKSRADVRGKLLKLLETKENYDVRALLAKVEGSWLLKETAVLYGRLGKHLDALQTIAVRLKDERTAEAYCLMTDDALQPFVDRLSPEEYSAMVASDAIFEIPPPASKADAVFPSREGKESVSFCGGKGDASTRSFCSIFSPNSPWKQQRDDLPQALRPGGLGSYSAFRSAGRGVPGLSSFPQFGEKAGEGQGGGVSPGNRKTRPRRSASMLRALLKVLLRAWHEAATAPETRDGDASTWKKSILNLLSKYGDHPDLEPSLVVRLLPDEWQLTEVADYLVASFRERLHEKMTASLQEQLSTVAYLHTYSDWARQRSSCYVVTPERSCPVCTRRLGLTAFVAYPDGTCVHLQCADGNTLHPSQEPPTGSSQFENNAFAVGAGSHSNSFLLS